MPQVYDRADLVYNGMQPAGQLPIYAAPSTRQDGTLNYGSLRRPPPPQQVATPVPAAGRGSASSVRDHPVRGPGAAGPVQDDIGRIVMRRPRDGDRDGFRPRGPDDDDYAKWSRQHQSV